MPAAAANFGKQGPVPGRRTAVPSSGSPSSEISPATDGSSGPPKPEAITRRRLPELDSLRGIAAVSVMLYHFFRLWETGDFSTIQKATILWPLRIVFLGDEAVLLFFLLSGFVLAMPAIHGKAQPYGVFMTRRIFRIYIPYLTALVLAVLGASIFHGPLPLSAWSNATWSRPVDPGLVLQHILLLGHYDHTQFNTSFWSLIHVMRIALVFPFLCALTLRIKPRYSLGLAAAFCLISGLLDLRWPRYHGAFLTIQLLAFTVAGILLAKHKERIAACYRSVGRRAHIAFAGACISLYCYGSLLAGAHSGLAADWLPAAGASGIIVVALNSSPARRALLARPIQFLGRISYSVYLLHGTILFALVHMLNPRLPLFAILPLYLAITLLASAGFYSLVEMPAMNAGRRIGRHFQPAIGQLQTAPEAAQAPSLQ